MDIKRLALQSLDDDEEPLEGEDDTTEFEWDIITTWKASKTSVQLKYSTDEEEEETITIQTKHVGALQRGLQKLPSVALLFLLYFINL